MMIFMIRIATRRIQVEVHLLVEVVHLAVLLEEINMTIEEVIEMLEDCVALANSPEEAKKLKEKFIENFKKEYTIIEN